MVVNRLKAVWVPLLALAGALLFTTIVLLGSNTSPLEAYRLILFGVLPEAGERPIRLADMIMLASPLLLCAAGLTLSFAAGQYNLGIEGQINIGAVFAMFALRGLPDAAPPLVWLLAVVLGMLGGALWALAAAALKIFCRVNEIFAGLGLNFVATGVTLYLVFGPWKRPGTASMSGTQQLPRELWLPTVEGLRLAPLSPLLALLAVVLVALLLSRTRWGLDVRAVGLNGVAAERMGVPPARRMAEAMALCGALAGVAGTLQVIAVFHNLTPNISNGIGLLALLVTLLVNASPLLVLPVALLFAWFTIGSTQLPLRLQVDSSIAGVLQGALVLFALLARGLVRR
jgi:general nucleoside transport system permease protein